MLKSKPQSIIGLKPSPLTYFLFLIIVASCNPVNKQDKVWGELPTETALDSFKQTEFAPTLENEISQNKNIIYAPSLLFAWDKVKEELKSTIITDNSNSNDFKLLTSSKSYQGSLTDKECLTSYEVNGDTVFVRAFFNMKLPFESKLQKLDSPMLFNKTKVLAFGMNDYDPAIINQCEILYYYDDDDFVLKLLPKDKEDEIILAKGLYKISNLEEAVTQTNNLINKANVEKKNQKLNWKYEMNQTDVFEIPILKFNIYTRYKNLEGQVFSTINNKKNILEEAYQRTGFIFNENGAVVESEAYTSTDSSALPIIIHPKKMIFDKPFYIIVKHINQKNPYFVMKVENTELLTKK